MNEVMNEINSTSALHVLCSVYSEQTLHLYHHLSYILQQLFSDVTFTDITYFLNIFSLLLFIFVFLFCYSVTSITTANVTIIPI